MPDTKKYLDIDGLTEYHETAGHSADIADGSITTAKLANGAVDNDKLAPMAVTASKIADKAITATKIASKAVDSYGLANLAVTTAKLAASAVTFDKINMTAVAAINDTRLIAVDSQTDQALTALHMEHRTLTPAQLAENYEYANTTNRLCWIKGTFLEVAVISFFGDLESGLITLYANGMHSTASGKLGVDTSWTIASN